ncbi:MAG: hypothetical protein GWN84_20825 [Gammaproteobacteria bacterium]|nr:hypothetical protein [Gammaproteobacteria bacterium]NIR85205.1 hypothetical protein [Gammaproteobacteria bacterium]NIU06255.1 hypothetical protein [Gammaproteobacteria bacterium]NIX87528.1 hypothetical protein [Gammaproteobacteria bacterium]
MSQLSIAVVDIDELDDETPASERTSEGAPGGGADLPTASRARDETLERKGVPTGGSGKLQPEPIPSEPSPVAPPVTPPAAAVAPPSVLELLDLPVRLLTKLPLTTTVLCRAEGVAAPIVLTTSKAAYRAARGQRWPVFVGGELVAMTLAAEHDRLFARDVVQWCERKAAAPEWRLGPEAAHGLGVAGRRLWARRWCLGPVLRAGGLEPVDVAAGDPAGLELVEGAGEGAS